MRQLGLSDIKIKISHAGLIKAILDSLELSPEEKSGIFLRILEGDNEALDKIKAEKPDTAEAIALLLSLKGKSSGFLKNIKALTARNMEKLSVHLDSFISVVEKLEELEVDYRIDLASGKGFEYYTGLIFHLSIGQAVIGGGGRYDELIPQMGGKAIPAAGFALYIDQLMKLIDSEVLAEFEANRIMLRMQPDVLKSSFELAEILRDFGFDVELCIDEKPASGCGWLLEVQSCSPEFTLTDIGSGQKSAVGSADVILRLLGCTQDAA